MDEVVVVSVVESSVMVEDPATYFQVTEADAPCESSQVFNSDIIPPEELQDLLGLRVSDVEDVLLLNPRVV